MKKKFCILSIIIIPFTIFAQFAKIVDMEGYVNIRESTNLNSKIIAKIKSNEIVYISNKGLENENWSHIEFEEKRGNIFSKYISGYIHNSRLKQINTFLLIPSNVVNEKGSEFNCCGVDVKIKSGKFDFAKNKKNFKKSSGYYTYKDKYAFGSWGIYPPKTHYLSITGYVGQIDFAVPHKDLENLFMINNELSECYFDDETKILYIILNNSDGSESYNALIIIENGIYKRIIINGDN